MNSGLGLAYSFNFKCTFNSFSVEFIALPPHVPLALKVASELDLLGVGRGRSSAREAGGLHSVSTGRDRGRSAVGRQGELAGLEVVDVAAGGEGVGLVARLDHLALLGVLGLGAAVEDHLEEAGLAPVEHAVRPAAEGRQGPVLSILIQLAGCGGEAVVGEVAEDIGGDESAEDPGSESLVDLLDGSFNGVGLGGLLHLGGRDTE